MLSGKIIIDITTGKSKGYGFIKLSNYTEYMNLIKSEKPFILNNKMLIIK